MKVVLRLNDETMTEYICDYPDCPNIALHVIAFVREINQTYALCAEHRQQQMQKEAGK